MRSKNIALILLATALSVSLWFNLKAAMVNHGIRDGTATTDIVRDTITDTVTYYMPLAKDSTVIRYVTERLPLSPDTLKDAEEYAQAHDSMAIVIPITQKKYEDSTYTAWVSGYHPQLDSISVYPTHEVITITKTKQRRWGIGVQAGYGVTSKGIAPYIGIGVQYNLLGF